jgi:hypothetical protein
MLLPPIRKRDPARPQLPPTYVPSALAWCAISWRCAHDPPHLSATELGEPECPIRPRRDLLWKAASGGVKKAASGGVKVGHPPGK